MNQSQKCILSVDVEDWFHILDLPSTPKLSEWDNLPSHVEQDFRKLLDLFREHGVKVTCFFLGWVGQKFPHLVKEAQADGHEIASHGYSHELVYSMTEQQFFEDAVKAKRILEDIAGVEVKGYRSAGFSATEDTPWFFDKLREAGYQYDSSVFPAPRGHGGMQIGIYGPHRINANSSRLIEFPITVTKFLGKQMCFFGGGYLRIFPYALIRKMANKVLNEGRPVVFYIHPREVNPDHPRLPMGRFRRFKSYVNLKTTQKKLNRIIQDFSLTTFESFIDQNPELTEAKNDYCNEQQCF